VDRAEQIFEELGFLSYLDIEPVRSEPAINGYTRYYFSTDDIQCYWGGEANVAVSRGTSNNVMFFMEGGGASWPGYSFAVQLDYLPDMGFKNRDPQNPLRDWNFVYVPYCDNSIHSGDADTIEFGRTVHHQGLRHTAAAAALARKLFPHPDKVLVTGSSAGGFGTYIAWPIVKSQYMDVDTYILDDSGDGFWDPGKPDDWETIKAAWNLHFPVECERCKGTIQTFIFELWMDIDPQLRVGMFSSWHDFIISRMFLRMDSEVFGDILNNVTSQIAYDYPGRFGRFIIRGSTHTCYEFILPGGANYPVDGVSLYEWIGQLVNDSPAWRSHIEPR
jgi:hypothetical protein